MNMNQSSPTVWKGELPKIGIRPTIDGRLVGVRESLEDQTMNLARRVADLISQNIHYPNGQPVACVIADTCIGGVSEAVACENQFRRRNVGVSLTVTPCWCYGSETMDMDPLRPKAVFGFNGTERPVRCIWPLFSPVTHKKAFPRSASMGATCKTSMMLQCPPMFRRDIGFRSMWFGRCVDAWQGLLVDGRDVDGDCRFDGRSRVLAKMARNASRRHRHDRVRRANEQRPIRSSRIRKALAWVKEYCPEGDDYNSERNQTLSRTD